MAKSSSGSLTNENSTLPIARIDTMDVPYVLPLREYLHTNGCQVFVNTGPTENVTYYMVVGDDDFVKRTLAFRHDFGKKQYIICWNVTDKEMLLTFLSPKSRIAFTDPNPLTQPILSQLFSFFFTGKHHEIDLTSGSLEQKSTIVNAQPLYKKKQEEVDSHIKEKDQEKKRIQAAIDDIFDLPQKKIEPEDVPSEPEPVSAPHPKNVVLLTIITFLVILSPWLCFSVSTLFRTWSLTNGVLCFKKGNIQCMKTELSRQEFWRTYQELPLPIITVALSAIGKDSSVASLERILFLFDTCSEIEKEMVTIGDSGTTIVASFFSSDGSSDTPSPLVAIDTLRKSIPILKTQMDIAYATLAMLKTDPMLTHPFIRDKISQVEEKLKILRQVGEVGEQIAQLYPYFSGFKDTQEILVLLQNNSELRPTGGFIGSVMHITVSDGVVSQMNVEDVYNLDGQLKGHIDPPEPIRTILKQEHWYLRDSNWDPDFSKSAAMARWFYEKEGGGNVDTVIGVTASFFVKLLAIVGPVDLPGYNDRITADNFYAKSLYYIQTNFFPGSTNKKDFLGTLMEALITKIQKNKQSAGLAILGALSDALLSHDIQWYTMKSETQAILERFGWGGMVPSHTTCAVTTDKSPCTFSYLHINEANLGVNKANAFVKRIQSRTISINERGEITESVTRRIQNTTGSELGGGDYTAFVRFFIPQETEITSFTLDGEAFPKKDPKKNVLPYESVDISTPGFLTVTAALTIPSGKEHVLTLTYKHKNPLVFGEGGAIFTPFEQKQAGIDEIPVGTHIEYPSYWKATILTGAPGAVVANQGKLEYNNTLTKDSEYTFVFTK